MERTELLEASMATLDGGSASPGVPKLWSAKVARPVAIARVNFLKIGSLSGCECPLLRNSKDSSSFPQKTNGGD